MLVAEVVVLVVLLDLLELVVVLVVGGMVEVDQDIIPYILELMEIQAPAEAVEAAVKFLVQEVPVVPASSSSHILHN